MEYTIYCGIDVRNRHLPHPVILWTGLRKVSYFFQGNLKMVSEYIQMGTRNIEVIKSFAIPY